MNANGPISDPDLSALLRAAREEIFASLRCHMPGVIVSFDKDKPSASVRIAAKALVFNQAQTLNGRLQTTPRIVDYPVLTDVPVFVYSGGGAVLTLPIAAGDECLVCFGDRDFDAWWQSGASGPPNSPRMHSLSDGFAIVGFRSRAHPVANYSATDAELRLGNAKVAVKGSGEVEVLSSGAASVKAKADGNVAALSANGSLLDLEDKVRLANGSGSLRAAMDLVVTALTALNGKTGPTAAVQIAAAQTALQALLKT